MHASRLTARLLPFFTSLLLATRAHAAADDVALAEARKMTRCAWMLITSAADVRNPGPEQKRSVELSSVMLLSRSAELGAPRPMQETWMKELAREAATATPAQKLGLFTEWSQCRTLMKREAARGLEAARPPQSLR